eukprot:gene98-5529_t
MGDDYTEQDCSHACAILPDFHSQPDATAPDWTAASQRGKCVNQQAFIWLTSDTSERVRIRSWHRLRTRLIFRAPFKCESAPLQMLRNDALTLLNESTPQTWEELISTARRTKGTLDLDGDGQADWALCFDTVPECRGSWLPYAIAASILQTGGSNTGALLDADSGRLLVGGPGMSLAMQLYRQLLQYNAPREATDNSSCRLHDPEFTKGSCLMTINFHQMLFPLHSNSNSKLAGIVVGAAPLPGSKVVQSRATGQLVPCMGQLEGHAASEGAESPSHSNCPFATGTRPGPDQDQDQTRTDLHRATRPSTEPPESPETPEAGAAVTHTAAVVAEAGATTSTTKGAYRRGPFFLTSNVQEFIGSGGIDGDEGQGKVGDGEDGGEKEVEEEEEEEAVQHDLYLRQAEALYQLKQAEKQALKFERLWCDLLHCPIKYNQLRNHVPQRPDQDTPSPATGERGPDRDMALYRDANCTDGLEALGHSPASAAQLLKAVHQSLEHPNAALDFGGLPGASALSTQPTPRAPPPAPPPAPTSTPSSSPPSSSTSAPPPLQPPPPAPAHAASSTSSPPPARPSINPRSTRPSSGPPSSSTSIPTGTQEAYQKELLRSGPRACPHNSHEISQNAIIAVSVTLGAAVLLLAIAVMYLWWRLVSLTPLTIGAVTAPEPVEATTLMVTDIQSSTKLWEELPAGAMDAALATHHAIVRALLPNHRGYESATEGDSFILAFHHPNGAAMFAVEFQEAMMEVDWPQELLEHPLCAQGSSLLAPEVHGFEERTMSFNHVDMSEISMSRRERQLGALSLRNIAFDNPTRRMSMSLTLPNLRRSVTNVLDAPKHFSCSLQQVLTDLWALSLDCEDQSATPKWASLVSDQTARSQGDQGGRPPRGSPLADPGGGGPPGGPPCPWRILRGGPTWGGGPPGGPPWLILGGGGGGPPGGSPLPLADPAGRSNMGRILVFRGLRVRVGMHVIGRDPILATLNQTSGRMQYSGKAMDIAKFVSDSGHGGQIIIDESVHKVLAPQLISGVAEIVDLGEHHLAKSICESDQEHHSSRLFQLLPLPLLPRVALLPPPKTLKKLSLSSLEAPVGHTTIAFFHALIARGETEAAQASIEIYHRLALRVATKMNGYVLELSDGLCLMAFTHPSLALVWALQLQKTMKKTTWPEKLRSMQLAAASNPGPGPSTASPPTALSGQVSDGVGQPGPGLVIQAGIDQGLAMDSVNDASRKLSYRGRVMNRAARLSTLAKPGQKPGVVKKLEAGAGWLGRKNSVPHYARRSPVCEN